MLIFQASMLCIWFSSSLISLTFMSNVTQIREVCLLSSDSNNSMLRLLVTFQTHGFLTRSKCKQQIAWMLQEEIQLLTTYYGRLSLSYNSSPLGCKTYEYLKGLVEVLLLRSRISRCLSWRNESENFSSTLGLEFYALNKVILRSVNHEQFQQCH